MTLSILEVLDRSAAYFEKAGIANARLNAEWLLAEVLGCKRLDLYLRFDKPLGETDLEKLRPLVKRRQQREPLQHILGSAPFHEIKLRCDARALIPRPETEQLVELVRELFPAPPARVLDLGTGSGAIALSLAKMWPQSEVTAVDASADALSLAAENAALNGLDKRVKLLSSDWFSNVQGSYELIVSNPPYLTREEWECAEPEVRNFDPYAALVAEDDGLADLSRILREAPAHLSAGGVLLMETGIAQHPALDRLAAQQGYASFRGMKDLSGRPRFFVANKGD